MPNMSLKKVAMPVQDPEVRCHNFEEVTTTPFFKANCSDDTLTMVKKYGKRISQ